MQLDPSEAGTHSPGAGRSLFQIGELKFGVAICHEGWRYPETVCWAASRGAHIVLHPQFHEAEPDGYRPSSFADPAKARQPLRRSCDGTLLSYQLYGKPGLLIADIDIAEATGLLAARCKYGTGFTRDESKCKTVDE